MASRSDILYLIIIIVSLPIVITIGYFNQVIGELVAGTYLFGIWLYAAYWGFNVRRALAVKLYRNQALGIALISILLIPDAIAHTLAGLGRQYYVAFAVIETCYSLVLFYFVDASVLAGRRSDPLLRDTLHWRTVRLYLWPVVVAVWIVEDSFLAYLQTTNVTVSAQIAGIGGALFGLVWLLPAIIVLPITAFRSKDPRLRSHFAWFAVFVALSFLPTLFGNGAVVVSTLVNGILLDTGLVFWGYALYKSARALVPLNKLEITSETR